MLAAYMKRIVKLLSIVTGIVMVVGAGALIVVVVRAVLGYINSDPKETAAALIIGMATVLGATLTVTLGRYFERKRELNALYRDKKTEIYDEFLKKLFKQYRGGAAG